MLIPDRCPRYRFAWVLLLILIGPVAAGAGVQVEPPDASPEESDDAEHIEHVTVRGKFVNPGDRFPDFDWTTLDASLVQLVQLNSPELPDSWDEMTQEQRRQWFTDFQATEEGKQLVEANQALIADRVIVALDVDAEGAFVAYDVPKGNYRMQAARDRKTSDGTYILQAYGQIEIADVEEIDLGEMPIEIVRLLKMNEIAPEIRGKTATGDDRHLADFRGKYVILSFAEIANPGFEQASKAISKALELPVADGKLAALTVAVDSDGEAAGRSISERGIAWDVIVLGGWEAGLLNEYGVKAVPSLWLIDPEGKIVLTGQQFLFELSRNGGELAQLVEDAINGKLKPGVAKEATGEDEKLPAADKKE